MNTDNDPSGDDSLGRAANRYVTFQIVSAIIGGIIFLIFLFAVFIPMFNRTSNGFSSQSGPVPITGPGSETVTIDGRPATPAGRDMIESQINKKSTPPASSSQTAPPH